MWISKMKENRLENNRIEWKLPMKFDVNVNTQENREREWERERER